MTAAKAALTGDIPAPQSRKCSQPWQGHIGLTGKRCKNVSSPPLPPPEKVRASSSPQAFLLPSPGREETRKKEDSGSPSNSSPQPSPPPSQPSDFGLYTSLKCGNLCEDTDIQPLGCHHSDFHSDLHPAMVEVWPYCWNSLLNMYVGSVQNM